MSKNKKRSLLEKLAERERLLKLIKVEGETIKASEFRKSQEWKKNHPHLDREHRHDDWTY
jgi:hypothetical protein